MSVPRSVLVAALGGSSLVCDVLDLLAEPGSPVPVTTRARRPAARLGRPARPGHRRLAVRPGRRPARAGRRGRSPRGLAAHRGRGRLAAGRRQRPGPRACTSTSRSPTPSSRTALWSLLTPVLRRGRRARAWCPARARCSSGSPTCSTRSPRSAGRARRRSSTRPRCSPLGLGETVPDRARRRRPSPGWPPPAPRRCWLRTARVPATYGALPDAASQVVACLDGPFGSGCRPRQRPSVGDDIFADPYLDGPPAPRLGLLALRDPDLDPQRVATSPTPSSSRRARRVPP